MAETNTAALVKQMVPSYDETQSLRDNVWGMTGFAPVQDDVLTAPTGPAKESPSAENRGYDNTFAALEEEYFRERVDSSFADRDDYAAVAEKAFYGSENFLDQVGTWAQVNSAYYLKQVPYIGDYVAGLAGNDILFGYVGQSTRGDDTAFYGEIDTVEEMYGEDWRSLTKDEMYAKREKHRLARVESHYGHVGDKEQNEAAYWTGWALSNIFADPSIALPTGAVGMAAKLTKAGLMGKTAAAATAGGATSAVWASAATALDQNVVAQEIDPARIGTNAALAGAVGVALPLVGGLANKLWTRHRRTGVPTDPNHVEAEKLATVAEYDEVISKLEKAVVPNDPNDALAAQQTLARYREHRAAALAVDSQTVAKTMSAADNSGPETDAASILDDAKRLVDGTATRSKDYLKIVNKMDREGTKFSLENVKNTKLYKALSPEEREILDDHIASLVDAPKKKKKKPTKAERQAAKDAARNNAKDDAIKSTNAYMALLKEHSPQYKYNFLQNMSHTAVGSGAGYGVGYAATEDHDSAMYWALTAGAVTLGAPLGKAMYGWSTKGKEFLNAENPLVRREAQQSLRNNFARSVLAGLDEHITNNNWTTTPIRQWENRGGVGKYLADLFRKTDEDYKMSVAGDMVEYGNIMARHGISPKETEIVQKLMRHTADKNTSGVLEKHLKAADDMRAVYNAQLQRGVKIGVIDQKTANALKEKAAKEGYVNRVYDLDFLRSKKGSQLFIDRMARVGTKKGKKGIAKEDAVAIIQALTGVKREQALKALTTHTKKEGGFVTFTHEGLRSLISDSHKGIAQPAQFLERDRSIPTRLEPVLEPFLVKDLGISYTKYSESLNRRFAYAKEFGVNNERMTGIADAIDDEMGHNLGNQAYKDLEGALFNPNNEYINRYFNASEVFKWSNNVVQHAQNSKLLLSAPLNFTQHLVYLPAKMASMGVASDIVPKMMTAYKESANEIFKEYQRRGTAGGDFLNRMGVLSDSLTFSATGDIAQKQANSSMKSLYGRVKNPDIWLKAGFEQVEHWNRRVAGHTGRAIVDDSLSRRAELVAKRRPSAKELKEIGEIESLMVDLGLDPKTHPSDLTLRQAEEAGNLAGVVLRDVNAPGAKDLAGQRLSNMTNFQSGYLHKPRIWNTPQGMWFGKFRNFMLHNTAFIRDDIIKPLAAGNALPAAIFLATGGVLGSMVNEIKDVMMNDNPDFDNTRMIFEGWGSSGVGGMYAEAVSQLQANPRNFMGFLAGPVFSDTVKAGNQLFTGVSQMMDDGETLALAEKLGEVVASTAPAKYVGSIYGRAIGESNPLRKKEDRFNEENMKELGL